MLVPATVRRFTTTSAENPMPHAELGLLAAGTLVGDQSE
jgi:hypothetical protein